MWPYLEMDKNIDKDFAQELIDCLFVLLNHVNKTCDDVSDQAFGNVDTGDALYCIQKHVFEDKDLTMAEIYEAMENNFGAELGAGCYEGPFVMQ